MTGKPYYIEDITSYFLTGVLIVMAVMLFFCLIRACLGPSVGDRIVSINMMGTMIMVMIAVLAVIKDEGYLVDICLIYALISFLAVIVLTKVYMGVQFEKKAKEEQSEESEAKKNGNI